jgi:hypothetical protein
MVNHLKLPYGSFCICNFCWNHIQSEENEITRHLREDHHIFTGRGSNNYPALRLIPEQVAVDLVGQGPVDRQKALHKSGLNANPKTQWATIPDIQGIYNARTRPMPGWVNNLALPPTGDMNTIYLVPIQQGGAAPAPVPPPAPPVLPLPLPPPALPAAPIAPVVPPVAPLSPPAPPTAPAVNNAQVVDLPIITPGPDKYNYLRRSGPGVGRVVQGQAEYTCRDCQERGDVVSMFDHHNHYHYKELQACFSKEYNDRYFAIGQVLVQTEEEQEEFDRRRVTLAFSNVPYAEGKSEKFHRDLAYHYRCHLCDFDGEEDFWALDEHFMCNHRAERQVIAEEILQGFLK